jgi:hypothetical protein
MLHWPGWLPPKIGHEQAQMLRHVPEPPLAVRNSNPDRAPESLARFAQQQHNNADNATINSRVNKRGAHPAARQGGRSSWCDMMQQVIARRYSRGPQQMRDDIRDKKSNAHSGAQQHHRRIAAGHLQRYQIASKSVAPNSTAQV